MPNTSSPNAMPGPEGPSPWVAYARLYTPKLVIALRDGYGLDKFRADALAGLTVAILALPLSMAIAIGAGGTPAQGLVTSVVAGLLISALGGSRFQIGGPAAAFIVVIAGIVHDHGWDGLATACFLAGLILVVAGFLKLGAYIRYVPGPVILGFTSAIGVLVALGQIKDFFGLTGDVPPDAVGRVAALVPMLATVNASAVLVGLGTLALIVGLKRWRPAWPGLLIAVVTGSAAVALLGLPVETIGTRFGGIPSSFPAPALPDLSWGKISDVMGSAFTMAFLIGVESLLSAVAADAIAGTRHRSNMEVVAQGIANMASPLFGGLPATGVIARTGTNISAGAQTPVAGVLHAVFVLGFILVLAPLASYLALPCLAAVLINVAWRLIDAHEVGRFLMRAPADDRIILAATLSLTVLVDLNVALAVGVVLASLLFTHRMAELPGVGVATALDDGEEDRRPASLILGLPLPDGVKVIDLRGPLFFGAAAQLSEAMRARRHWPRVLIIRMRDVPLIDATAIAALDELARLCRRQGCRILMSGLQRQPRAALHRFGFLREHRIVLASNSYVALEKAKTMLATPGADGRP